VSSVILTQWRCRTSFRRVLFAVPRCTIAHPDAAVQPSVSFGLVVVRQMFVWHAIRFGRYLQQCFQVFFATFKSYNFMFSGICAVDTWIIKDEQAAKMPDRQSPLDMLNVDKLTFRRCCPNDVAELSHEYMDRF
jgi:hypothetical protein